MDELRRTVVSWLDDNNRRGGLGGPGEDRDVPKGTIDGSEVPPRVELAMVLAEKSKSDLLQK